MNASELRIGNLVKINNDFLPETHGKTYIVYKLQKTFDFDFPPSAGIVSVTDKVNTYSQFDQFIEPIPLTEEWLLKFGFELSKTHCTLWMGNGFPFIIEKITDYWWVCDMNITSKVYYVHHLQNLYFALTGEELTLKETQNERDENR